MKAITTLILAAVLAILPACGHTQQRSEQPGTAMGSNKAPAFFSQHFGVDFGRSDYFIYQKMANAGVSPTENKDEEYTYEMAAVPFNGDVFNGVTIMKCEGKFCGISYSLFPVMDIKSGEHIYNKYKEEFCPDVTDDDHGDGSMPMKICTHRFDDNIVLEIQLVNSMVYVTIVDTSLYKGSIGK